MKVSTWEKLRKAVTGSYSDWLTLELAKEKAELEAQHRAARERILAQQEQAKAAPKPATKKATPRKKAELKAMPKAIAKKKGTK